MKFLMPTLVYSEENCVLNHSAELAALGSRALIVTGKRSARRCGAFADVTAALDKHGISWVEFAEVEENPSVETVMRARQVGCKVKADFVIGIGGGSPMDAAKAIALMIRHPDRDWDYLYDKTAETTTLPIAEIPTTAGTGSEVTAVSVLTRHDIHVKGSIPHKIFADLALIDGKYVSGAPAQILANTTMDALCHLYESYIHTAATDFSRMCAEAGIRVWARSKDVILGRREASAEDYRNKVEPLMDQLRAAKEAYLAIANDANETLIQLDAAANVLQSEYPNQIFAYTDGTIREVPDPTEWKNHAHRFEPWWACQLATETGEKARPHDSVLYAAWRAVGNAYPRKFF